MEKLKKFTLEELYIQPFTARRVYDEEGRINWVPVERKKNPTGYPHLDFIVNAMAEGLFDMKMIASFMDCTMDSFNGYLKTLTGMTAKTLRKEYMFRLADDLLRYTSMTADEVAQRIGLSSSSSLSQQFKKYRHVTVEMQRKLLREERDEGRYRID